MVRMILLFLPLYSLPFFFLDPFPLKFPLPLFFLFTVNNNPHTKVLFGFPCLQRRKPGGADAGVSIEDEGGDEEVGGQAPSIPATMTNKKKGTSCLRRCGLRCPSALSLAFLGTLGHGLGVSLQSG